MLSDQIHQFLKNHQTGSLASLIAQMGQASFGILICIIALPSALPLPAPGYSVPFGLMLVVLALQILAGRSTPWFPHKITNYSVSLSGYQAKLKFVVKFIKFFERLIHPRLHFVFIARAKVIAFFLLLCGLLMCIPIPGTNTIPALGAFLIGLGMIEKDGLIVILGSILSLLGLAISVVILWLGHEALQALLQL